MKYTNIIYFRYINKIGGIETWLYQIAKKYKSKDITIFYQDGDLEQIRRLKKYVRVIKYNNQEIECDKAFFNFNLDIINKVKAKEYIQIIHGDYKSANINPNTHPRITKYIGVSQIACDSFKEITEKEIELVYNPLEIAKPKKVLNLISATRLTSEKGKDRIIKLAKMFDEKKIPYLWIIFTDDTQAINNSNIVYMKTKLDVTNYIANADYLVQLSNNEGYCYSVVESLCVGTPVIVTDMPVMKEIGVNETNGFIVDFNLSNVDIEKIYNTEFKFNYKPKSDTWNKQFKASKSTYKYKEYEVESLMNILFAEENIQATIGTKFTIEDEERLNYLLEHNAVKLLEKQVEVDGEI